MLQIIVAVLINQGNRLTVKLLHLFPVFPQAIRDITIPSSGNPQAVLLPLVPPSLILTAILPRVDSETVFLIVSELPTVLHFVSICVESVAMAATL